MIFNRNDMAPFCYIDPKCDVFNYVVHCRKHVNPKRVPTIHNVTLQNLANVLLAIQSINIDGAYQMNVDYMKV